MDRDGTGLGFDCELTSAIASSVSIPVIASGGAGNAQHFVDVFSSGRADAALAASIFHFGTHAVADLKQTLLHFATEMFGATKIRLRPSFFPFTWSNFRPSSTADRDD